MNQSRPNLAMLKPSICGFLETGEPPDGLFVLHNRSHQRGALLRYANEAHNVLVKLWLIQNHKERLKASLRLSQARHEWNMYHFLRKQEINTPEPLEFGFIALPNGMRLEAMLIQDLGEVKTGVEYLNRCVIAKEYARASKIEDAAIRMTSQLLRLGVTDIDHHLTNIIVDSNHSIFRIDFECARRWRLQKLPSREIGKMLGRMISTHIFACQEFDLARSRMFSERLVDSADVHSTVLATIKSVVEAKLERQRQSGGPNIHFVLPR